jgi:hypothetical protein
VLLWAILPHVRCRDDEDDEDGDDDDINDPMYDQDELTGSQLAYAPQVHKLRCVCHYQVVHEAIIRV